MGPEPSGVCGALVVSRARPTAVSFDHGMLDAFVHD